MGALGKEWYFFIKKKTILITTKDVTLQQGSNQFDSFGGSSI